MHWAGILLSLELGSSLAAVELHEPAAELVMRCAKPAHVARIEVPAGHGLARVGIQHDSAGWLRIEERGQELRLEVPGGTSTNEIAVPPRYGVFLVELQPGLAVTMSRVLPGSAEGSIVLSAICGSTPELDWDIDAAKLSPDANRQLPVEQLESLRERLSVLTDKAPDPTRAATALHLAAQSLLFNDRSNAAAVAFARAESAWMGAGDTHRASAARVGQVEDLQRAGKYEEVLALIGGTMRDPSPYFRARLEDARCLVLRSLGRSEESLECFSGLLNRFDQLGEGLDWLSSLQSYALLHRDLGEYEPAEQLARDALDRLARFESVQGPEVPTVLGRTHWLLSDLALRRGDVPAALQEADAALAAFSEAKVTRWEANTMLRVAEVYSALGAGEEALSFATEARARFSPVDAPARVAAADLVLARLALDRRQHGEAARLAVAAGEVFARLSMPAELEAARLVEATALLRQGDSAAAATRLVPPGEAHAINATERQLLLAGLELDRGALPEARKRLDELASIAAPQLRARVAVLEADYWTRSGARERALETLWSTALELRDTAARLQSPVLRQLLQRSVEPLRTQAFALLTPANATDEDAAARVWPWLMLDVTPQLGVTKPEATGKRDATSFDALLAQELLPIGSSAPDRVAQEARKRSQRALLDYLAHAPRGSDTSRIDASLPTLEGLQASLHKDAAFLALVDSGETTTVFWAAGGKARLLPAGRSAALRSAIEAHAKGVRDHKTPLADISRAGATVGASLFGAIANEAAPSQLHVLGGGLLASVPWTTVAWPGDSRPMIDSTVVQLVTMVDTAVETAGSQPESVAALVAPGSASDGGALPALAGAGGEPDLIRNALRDSAVKVDAVNPAGRDSMLAAISRSSHWVHIAAHGTHEPNRLGYSGVWVEPASPGSGRPEFLSWLDVLERGAHAQLVVLNACRLAQADSEASLGALNFAAAVSRAGAHDVIAALWPVSDTATGIWVPSLYGALIRNGQVDPASALRVAQLRLRESRAFRHPAYWAALTHLGHFSAVSASPRPGLAQPASQPGDAVYAYAVPTSSSAAGRAGP